MLQTPTVSVIIPVYNRPKQLKVAVDSVLSQSFSDFELIIVDDGSDDSLVSYIEELKHSYPQKIQLIIRNNRGVSAARNAGIKRASGEYVAFLDSDDMWINSKLSTQIETMKKRNIMVSQTDEIWIRNSKRVNPMNKHQKRSGRIFYDCLPLCIVSPSAVMIHRDVFEQVGLFDERLPAVEDYDLWLRISIYYPIYLINQTLIHKTGGHEDQLSKKYWGMDRFRIYAMKKLLRTCSSRLDVFKKRALYWWIGYKAGIVAEGAGKRARFFRWAYYAVLSSWYRTRWRCS